MLRSAAIALAVLVGIGCVSPVAQPTPTGPAAPASPRPATPSPAALAPSPTVAPTVPPGLGPAPYHQLPQDPRGTWVSIAPLAEDAVLTALLPDRPGYSATAEDRLRFRMLMGRFEVGSGAVTTLVELGPGATIHRPVVVGRTVAWVETSAVVASRQGWKLHLTDAVTGADRVVVADPGVRAHAALSGTPVIGYDGRTLVYSVLAPRQDGHVWQLRRLADGREDTIAELPDVRDQLFMTVALDDRSIVWIEHASRPSQHGVIGVYDRATGAVTRRPTALEPTNSIALSPERIFLGTSTGVMETDRSASYEPKLLRQATYAESLVVVGRRLLYLSGGGSEALLTIDLESGEQTQLSTAVTGLDAANGLVHWFERAREDIPMRFAIVRP